MRVNKDFNVKDEVRVKTEGVASFGIITKMSGYEHCFVLWGDGSSGRWSLYDLEKTGMHYENISDFYNG